MKIGFLPLSGQKKNRRRGQHDADEVGGEKNLFIFNRINILSFPILNAKTIF
jgi:hypothetical protein